MGAVVAGKSIRVATKFAPPVEWSVAERPSVNRQVARDAWALASPKQRSALRRLRAAGLTLQEAVDIYRRWDEAASAKYDLLLSLSKTTRDENKAAVSDLQDQVLGLADLLDAKFWVLDG